MTTCEGTEPMAVRLYTPVGIAVGTLFGSLAAGAVLLWLNYRALGYHALANKVAAGSGVLYLIVIGAASALPDHPILGVAFMALQTGLAYWTAWILQGDAIAYHLTQGGAVHSTLRAAGVGVVAGLSVLLLLTAVTGVFGLSVPVSPAD
jgi:hypothetical protein